MKRWLTHALIATYLSALSWGIISHTVNYGTAAHPVMYFLVWDMFCGWTGYELRLHVIGEGESGQHYELAPGPWGDFYPYGDIGRRHYDVFGFNAARFALNSLRHTDHEPITRIFVVEENWCKKFNLPDDVWQLQCAEPKEPCSYFNVRHVLTADGVMLKTNHPWMSTQFQRAVTDNPRLQWAVRANRPFLAPNAPQRPAGSYAPGSLPDTVDSSPFGSRVGN